MRTLLIPLHTKSLLVFSNSDLNSLNLVCKRVREAVGILRISISIWAICKELQLAVAFPLKDSYFVVCVLRFHRLRQFLFQRHGRWPFAALHGEGMVSQFVKSAKQLRTRQTTTSTLIWYLFLYLAANGIANCAKVLLIA